MSLDSNQNPDSGTKQEAWGLFGDALDIIENKAKVIY